MRSSVIPSMCRGMLVTTLATITGLGTLYCVYVFGYKKRGTKEEDKCESENKFAVRDGITFYYFPRSPCARRVWVTILEKKVQCHMVMVDIMCGEQRHPRYLEINPQGKVPAIRVHNHASLPDCILYESQAIVEWFDEQFPDTTPLYPRESFDARMQVKMWQYWELSMAEDMWPLSRQQVDGIIWRFIYSRKSFYESGPPREASTDSFYTEKVSKVYEGTYLSRADATRRALRTLRAFKMLDMALEAKREIQKHHNQSQGKIMDAAGSCLFLVGDTFTQADIASYPRLCKVPQNGLVSTEQERVLFPNVCAYFASLRHYNSFSQFSTVDEVIWNSGYYPKFVPQWWGQFIPWWIVVAVGNYRASLASFERITQASLGADAVGRAMALVVSTPMAALPYVISEKSNISFHFHEDSDLESRDSENSLTGTPDSETILYCSSSMPMAVATRVCLYIQHKMCQNASLNASLTSFPSPSSTSRSAFLSASACAPHPSAMRTHIQPVDTVLMENLAPAYLQLMPFGEVPVLVHKDKVIYGPHLIVEYMDELLFSNEAERLRHGLDDGAPGETKSVLWQSNSNPSAAGEPSCRLLPSLPVERAIVRRWFGWCRTAYFYQIEPLYTHLVLPSHLLHVEGIDSAEKFTMRVVEKGGVLMEDASLYLEGAFGCRVRDGMSAYIQELSARIDTVEAELRQTSSDSWGKSLLGHLHFTYADYFVLGIVMLAEVYQGSTVSPLVHPFTYTWKATLLADAKVAALYDEMCKSNSPSKPLSHNVDVVAPDNDVPGDFDKAPFSPLAVFSSDFWTSL